MSQETAVSLLGKGVGGRRARGCSYEETLKDSNVKKKGEIKVPGYLQAGATSTEFFLHEQVSRGMGSLQDLTSRSPA